MARPWPVRAPPDCLILESALWPQITPGMALKIEKQVRLRMPNTRLQIASAEFFGWGALPGSGGMVSFIDLIGLCWFGNAWPDHYTDPRRNFNNFRPRSLSGRRFVPTSGLIVESRHHSKIFRMAS